MLGEKFHQGSISDCPGLRQESLIGRSKTEIEDSKPSAQNIWLCISHSVTDRWTHWPLGKSLKISLTRPMLFIAGVWQSAFPAGTRLTGLEPLNRPVYVTGQVIQRNNPPPYFLNGWMFLHQNYPLLLRSLAWFRILSHPSFDNSSNSLRVLFDLLL